MQPKPTPPPGSVAVIVPAAGSGRRFGSETNKLFAKIDGVALWVMSVRRLRDQPCVGRIVLPIADADRDYFLVQHAELAESLGVEFVAGGDQRSDSVRQGLKRIEGDESVRWIAVHDAARPLVSPEDLQTLFSVVISSKAAILAAPLSGTIRRDLGSHTQTVNREDLYEALTPQVFDAGLLRHAYSHHNGRPATDDAELVERTGHAISIVRGSADNLKITYPEDLLVAEAILARQQAQSNHAR
ncbi:2-C-methyl-D-erythritol 4-phosphate cytidylyltransferase [Rubripirellula obstinata]|nr:2-C-methyl-D-erythritol 4-phosphate cytidylyltransferase [Rubripirellula obstinata]